MSIVTSKPNVWAGWQWPADVKQFAASHGGEEYLEPLREALAGLFPTAVSASVRVYLDPELRDERHILFDVRVPGSDLGDLVKAKRTWVGELMRICPSVKLWLFGLYLVPLDS
jgi:hypothetical protein